MIKLVTKIPETEQTIRLELVDNGFNQVSLRVYDKPGSYNTLLDFKVGPDGKIFALRIPSVSPQFQVRLDSQARIEVQ